MKTKHGVGSSTCTADDSQATEYLATNQLGFQRYIAQRFGRSRLDLAEPPKKANRKEGTPELRDYEQKEVKVQQKQSDF
uniref:Uncharacterized protein n=1 Tax=Timema bartmani TaxID=61472 RepID=A0A7R9F1T0_9NEOP|nr:unnamed protein product [Timema bartmani]